MPDVVQSRIRLLRSRVVRSGRHDPQGGKLKNDMTKLLLPICLVAVALDLFFFTGYYASDDQSYFEAAARVAETGTLREHPLLGATRLTVLGWNTAFGALSRFNVQFMSASYVLAHVILILLTYLLAKKVYGPTAGLIAAYTSAVFPLYVIFSTSIYPDLLIAIGFVLSVLAFMKAYEFRERGRIILPMVLMLLCGMSVGLAYMAKENGLVALPFYLVAWLGAEWKQRRTSDAIRMPIVPAIARDGRTGEVHASQSNDVRTGETPVPQVRQRAWWVKAILTGVCFPIGFAAVFTFEHRMLVHLTGNPEFFRLGWTEKKEDLQAIPNFHRDGGYNPINRFKASMERLRYEYFPDLLKVSFFGGLLLYPFVGRRGYVVVLFGLWIYAFSTWGTYSFKHYYPPRLQARYYIPAFPFIIAAFSVSMAWLIEQAATRLRRPTFGRVTRGVLIAGIALSPLTYLRGPNALSWQLYRTYYVRHVQRAVEDSTFEQSPLIVLSDHLAKRLRPMWYRGRPADPHGRRPKVMLSSAELPSINWSNVAKSGFLHYVEIDNQISKETPRSPATNLDQLMHPAIRNKIIIERPAQQPSRSVKRAVPCTFFASLDSDGIGVAWIPGYQLSPMLQSRYKREFRSRTRELIHWMTSSTDFGDDYYRNSFSVDRYRVNVRQADPEIEQSIELLDAASAAGVSWTISNAEHATLRVEADGLLSVAPTEVFSRAEDVEAAAPRMIHLAPDCSTGIPVALRLPARGFFKLQVDLEVEKSVEILLGLRAYPSSEMTDSPIFETITSVESGVSEVAFFTGEQERHIVPMIGVPSGRRLTVRNVRLAILRAAKPAASGTP